MASFAASDLDRFIGLPEAARRLGIAKSTAYKLVAAGTFPVPVGDVNGHPRVYLRRLVDFMAGDTTAIEAQAS